MIIVGISAFYHDSAAALIQDGKIIAAAQEERFTRKKHDAGFPLHALQFVLDCSNTKLSDVDYVVFYDKPFLKFERIVETYLATVPASFASFRKAMPVWLKEKLFQKKLLADQLKKLDSQFDAQEKLLFTEHHQSHAASAFYPSPFSKAAILTMDGVGEWATTSAGFGEGNQIHINREIHFPHSLGLLYSAFTFYCGFKINSGEYKLMGLAPYGQPVYADKIKQHLIDIKDDGSFHLNQDYFNYCSGLTMTSELFHQLFGRAPRAEESAIEPFHMDIAASIQAVTEAVVSQLVRGIRQETDCENLCLSGGVALNCVANGKLLKDKLFDRIWVQPASGDAGSAVGAALTAWHYFLDNPRTPVLPDQMQGSYLGPEYTDAEIERCLVECGAVYEKFEFDEICKRTATALAAGDAVGWFQGRMEFGPRALGNRSILADPRQADMQKKLNLKIKYRESFRPFAPSVLLEHVQQWFDLDIESAYMLFVSDIHNDKKLDHPLSEQSGLDRLQQARSTLPAITHVDYSARVQTVNKKTNPAYHQLIEAFYSLTGVPVLVNTSFNVRGEPIVCTPSDAFRCFINTELDKLVIGHFILDKNSQTREPDQNYKQSFTAD